MVSVMIAVVKNLSQLSIEAPEWYPMEHKFNEENIIRERYDEVRSKREDWQIPRRCYKKENIMRNKIKLNRLNANNGKNYYEVLSNDNNEEEDTPGEVVYCNRCELASKEDEDEENRSECKTYDIYMTKLWKY